MNAKLHYDPLGSLSGFNPAIGISFMGYTFENRYCLDGVRVSFLTLHLIIFWG